MNWSGVGAIALALAVMAGAFGAHALRGRLDAYSLDVYEKAVFYHFIHAIGLLVVPTLTRHPDRVCWLLMGGVVVFSGTLYVLSITGQRWLGAITPIGGLAFIAGWLLLAWDLFRGSSQPGK